MIIMTLPPQWQWKARHQACQKIIQRIMRPNSHAWAYNSGTSFATPIISALAARILEQEPESGDLHQAIVSASRGQQTVWTGVADSKMVADVKDESGPMILAMQDWNPEDTSSQ